MKNKNHWRHQKLLNYLKNNFDKNIKILELGPGDGTMVYELLNAGFTAISLVDRESNIVYPQVKKAISILTVDLNTQPINLPEKSFDLILALQILEHLENPWHFKRECQRLLKTGGRLIVSIPYGFNLASKLRFFLKGNIMRYEKGNEHITFLTKNVFHKLFLKEFVLEREDYSEPKLKLFKLVFPLPNWKIIKKLFSKNVYYFLKKV